MSVTSIVANRSNKTSENSRDMIAPCQPLDHPTAFKASLPSLLCGLLHQLLQFNVFRTIAVVTFGFAVRAGLMLAFLTDGRIPVYKGWLDEDVAGSVAAVCTVGCCIFDFLELKQRRCVRREK